MEFIKDFENRFAKKVANKLYVILFLLFAAELFLRFWNIEMINGFGWDQLDNAWTAKNLIINGKVPLVGMVAKGNSGIFIGPAYYYLISFFYWIYDLNPVASGMFAGITSVFTFWSLFFVAKKR